MTNIVGIDLGTTNTCIAHLHKKIPTIIPLKGHNTIPSSIKINSTNVFAIKRLIGQKYTDIKNYLTNLPYKTIPHTNNDIWISINNKKLSPVDISSRILRNVKSLAESKIGTINDVVITVPAYFNESQRQATKDAGRIAGFNVIRVINEPTAAALAYGLDKSEGIVAVYDLGGGTFDISILEIKNGIFEVLSTNGNNQLGGEDIDNEIRNNIVNRYEKEAGIELCKTSKQRIKEEVEEMKKQLSYKDEYTLKINNLVSTQSTVHNLEYTYKINEIENMVKHIIDKTVEPCLNAIKDSKLTKDKIKHIILVGGSTRMPLVRRTVTNIFDKEPETGVNPDEVVAKGAAIQCGILKGVYNDIILLDVSSLSLGIETVGGLFSKIINRNEKLPCKVSQIFTTSEDNQEEVEIKIYQGERPMVKFNKFLSEIKLILNNKLKRGEPRIEVTFDGDANGIFKVTAKDMITGKENKVNVKPASGLTEEEIERIVNEANEREKEDNEYMECVKVRQTVEKLKKQGHDVESIENEMKDEVFEHSKVKEMIKQLINKA